MLSKSISLVSLPLARRLSPPFGCIRHHHRYPCRSTISQDAQPAWTRRAQPVADSDRRASLRKFSHALLKAPLFSAILTVRPFASTASRRGKPRPAVHDLRIVVGGCNARRMRMYHWCNEGQIAHGASRRNPPGVTMSVPAYRAVMVKL